jgi:periplasmic mercuric ion binding protein
MKTTLGIVGVVGALCICPLCETALGNRAISYFSAAAPPSVASSADETIQAQAPAPAVKVVALKIEGMTCGGCVFGVKKVLTRLNGVSKAVVSYETRSAVVTFDPAKVTVEQMVGAIKTLGYKATVS